jgi:hypothetical protein
MRKNLRFVGRYLSLNLSAALEYRAALLAQALCMMLNDALFFVFWALYFRVSRTSPATRPETSPCSGP